MGLAALVLGVLIAQIAVAGGSKDGKVASLERDNQSLQRRVSALEALVGPGAKVAKKKKAKRGPRGPAGPQGPPGSPGSAGSAGSCQGNGSGDVMVAAGAVCIDKYEASVWDASQGGTRLVSEAEIDAACPNNGQDCVGTIFARSVPGVEPASSITWFQAQQALANSGKRLPTNAEWQQTVAGTPDTGGADNETTDCNTDNSVSPDVANTGSRADCVSDWGAFDMVGNLAEWVADWDEQADACANYGAGEFGGDQTCLGDGTPSRFPGALIRGGNFNINFDAGAGSGPFALFAFVRPSGSDDGSGGVGFRGAR